MKKAFIKSAKAYFLISLGTVMLTLGVYFFKIPNGFATGGVSGIGTLLAKITPNISAATWILVINILLLILGFSILGRQCSLRTLYCSMLFSGLTMVFEKVFPLTSPITDQPLLELIYAMALTSAGSAIIFNCSASSGGTDIIALILKKYSSLDVGKSLLVTDFLIASCSFFLFGAKAGLFSLLGLFSKAFLVDLIIDNVNSYKYFVVITEHGDKISEFVMTQLHHGATVTEAIGTYTQHKKTMIHTVCNRLEAIRLRREIKEIDPQAFIVITTTSEIIGRGFRSV